MDNLTKEQRHRNMKNIKSKDTKIEVRLRKALWAKGYRYRKNDKKLPGKPDIVLSKYKIVIFCDSEFFHGKDWEVLKPRLEKGTHPEYWVKKIENNRKRDEEINKELLKENIFGGKDLSHDFPELGQCALYCVSEITTLAELEHLRNALKRIVKGE